MCVLASLCVYAPNKSPPSFPLIFISTSNRLPNFYFLCDRSYNLKMQMWIVVIIDEDLFVLCVNLH